MYDILSVALTELILWQSLNRPHYAQFAELHQYRQCLVHHFLESSRKSGLKFYVVHVDEVDMVNVEALHALIDTFLCPACGIVPGVYTVFSISSYFRTEKILVTRNVLQCLAKHGLCFVVAIIRTDIDEIDAAFNGCLNCFYAVVQIGSSEYAA